SPGTWSVTRQHCVKLSDNFNLGFYECVSTLPKTEDAHRLGQELAQIQLLLNLMIESRVDSITMFRRVGRDTAGAGGPGTSPTPSPPPRASAAPAASKMIQRRVVEFSVSA